MQTQYMFVFFACVRQWNYSVPVFLQHVKGFQGVLEKNPKIFGQIFTNLSGFAILWDIHKNIYTSASIHWDIHEHIWTLGNT